MPVKPSESKLEELQARLTEAEETLQAIRNGDVDAVVVGSPAGQKVYTLENADRPYRVLVEQMQEGAITLSEDGTVLYCNERFAKLVHGQRQSLVGTPVTRFIDERDRAFFSELLTKDSIRDCSYEFLLVAVDGLRVPVSISLAALFLADDRSRVLCGIVTDLTHSERRNHELAASNARLAREIDERRRAEDSLQLALDAAAMGNWELDLVTDTAGCSPQHDLIFGHSHPPEKWGLRSALEQFLKEDRLDVIQAFAQAETTGSLDFQKRIRRAGDGKIRWLHIMGRTHYENGKPVRLGGVVSDVTDKRLMQEQLRQAQKMDAIGQLTGGVAHDFNNLLMVIGGSLELLGDRLANDERAQRLLTAARRGVARGATLNQQLLAFSRRQHLRTEAVCVDQVISAFETLLDRAVGETVTVDIRRTADLWLCKTDPNQLETAILNLAINARDAMPQGGRLTLSTAIKVVDEKAAEACATTPGDYVVVTVSDTGTGMSPETVSRAFEPFFTTKEVGKGTGLGLSQVYGFAKQSGGFLTIESEFGCGTRVSIHLPRTQSPDKEGEIVTCSPIVEKGEGVVLVVEDDVDVREITAGMIRKLGYAVIEAQTAQRALALIGSGKRIDLLFSDVIMPGGMNGVELVHELDRGGLNVPVLLTSGYTGQRFTVDACSGDLPLLRKPYSLVDLAKAIDSAMKR